MRGDYFFWTVLVVLLAFMWGILGLTVYLSVVVSWTVGLTAPWILVLCLYTTWLVCKTIREQREVYSE